MKWHLTLLFIMISLFTANAQMSMSEKDVIKTMLLKEDPREPIIYFKNSPKLDDNHPYLKAIRKGTFYAFVDSVIDDKKNGKTILTTISETLTLTSEEKQKIISVLSNDQIMSDGLLNQSQMVNEYADGVEILDALSKKYPRYYKLYMFTLKPPVFLRNSQIAFTYLKAHCKVDCEYEKAIFYKNVNGNWEQWIAIDEQLDD